MLQSTTEGTHDGNLDKGAEEETTEECYFVDCLQLPAQFVFLGNLGTLA